MKVLVLGAGGMAGHVIAITLAERGYDVTGLAKTNLPWVRTVVADIRNSDTLPRLTRFDAIVNCIGVLNRSVDSDPYTGIWLNSCLPHLLVNMTRKSSTRIIHLSTDCVFSGDDGHEHREDSPTSALSAYGRSKALGELVDDKNLTFRTSIVGPDVRSTGIGLFNWFMRQEAAVTGYAKVIWSGVTTMTLAQAVIAALEHGTSGLYHLVNNETISKLDLLNLFNGLRMTPITIYPSLDPRENRSLVNSRNDLPFTVPNYVEMIDAMGRWIEEHRDRYPHYRFRTDRVSDPAFGPNTSDHRYHNSTDDDRDTA